MLATDVLPWSRSPICPSFLKVLSGSLVRLAFDPTAVSVDCVCVTQNLWNEKKDPSFLIAKRLRFLFIDRKFFLKKISKVSTIFAWLETNFRTICNYNLLSFVCVKQILSVINIIESRRIVYSLFNRSWYFCVRLFRDAIFPHFWESVVNVECIFTCDPFTKASTMQKLFLLRNEHARTLLWEKISIHYYSRALYVAGTFPKIAKLTNFNHRWRPSWHTCGPNYIIIPIRQRSYFYKNYTNFIFSSTSEQLSMLKYKLYI